MSEDFCRVVHSVGAFKSEINVRRESGDDKKLLWEEFMGGLAREIVKWQKPWAANLWGDLNDYLFETAAINHRLRPRCFSLILQTLRLSAPRSLTSKTLSSSQQTKIRNINFRREDLLTLLGSFPSDFSVYWKEAFWLINHFDVLAFESIVKRRQLFLWSDEARPDWGEKRLRFFLLLLRAGVFIVA